MTSDLHRPRRRGSLFAALSLLWLALVAWRVQTTLVAQRYLELGYEYLALLAVRDVVADALPLLVVGIPVTIGVVRLARRPRALAALSVALPLTLVLVLLFASINAAIAELAGGRRTLRALVLVAVALVPALAGLGFAALAGRRWGARAAFERWARRFDGLALRVRKHLAARIVGSHVLSALAVILAACALVAPQIATPARPEGPPVIVVLVDTLRADHLGIYGYGRDTSPHIDAWAASATVFERGIAQASWTKPSVASLFTGLYPSVHLTGSGTHQRRRVVADTLEMVAAPPEAPATTGTLPAGLVTFAEVFRNAGYATAAFVANGLLTETDGYAQGFETYEILDDRRVTREGVGYLTRNAETPFLLYLHYMAPHAPYDPPAAFDRFGAGARRGTESGDDARFDLVHTATKDSINFTRTLELSPEQLADLVDQYDGEIAFADELIESVLSAVGHAGLGDRAVVVVTADHGEEFLDHGMVWHESVHLYDELIRVPFIVRAPGGGTGGGGVGGTGGGGTGEGGIGEGGTGRRIAEPVMQIDLAPTLLEAAGVSAPDEMQGRSLLPLLHGRPLPPGSAFAETIDWGNKQATWRRNQKLIVDHEAARLELYDLAADPAERIDRSGSDLDVRAALLDSTNVQRERSRALRARVDVERLSLAPEQLERLRSLGYIQ